MVKESTNPVMKARIKKIKKEFSYDKNGAIPKLFTNREPLV